MKKTINFEKAYTEQHGRKQRGAAPRGGRVALLVLALCAAVTGGAAGAIRYQQYRADRESEAIAVFLHTSPQALEYQRLQDIQSRYTALAAYNDQVEGMADTIRLRPLFTEQAYAALQKPLHSGMSLQSLSLKEDGSLSALFTCSSGADAADYVEALRTEDFFENVRYNGWSSKETCYFQLNCSLKEGEGW